MNPTDRILLGTRKGLILLERDHHGWRTVKHMHAGIPVPYACVDERTGWWWTSLHHGHWAQKLERSTDGGNSWEELPAPRYPEQAEIKDGVAATTRYLWVIAPGGKDQPGTLYIGTEPGGLFRSDDGGRSFALVEGLWNHPSRMEQWFGGGLDHPGIHSVFVDPRDSRRVLVGISCAGVFETLDGGLHWAPRNRGLTASFLPDPHSEIGQDPHLLASCRSAPDLLWQQNHCGIFRSTDGAQSWQLVSQQGGPAHFGFAVAVDAEDGHTAWVVPAVSDEIRTAIGGALCVCRTSDGGATWTALRRGLPQQDCYDVVFRHALDLAGKTLAFGTTTGNVFVSDDRGDTWQCVGHHFPPIYSVRSSGLLKKCFRSEHADPGARRGGCAECAET